jgi:hypothetical protein
LGRERASRQGVKVNGYEIVKQMKEEIESELLRGEDLEEIKDRSGEIVDGYLPIYNNQILEEWSNLPNDYDNRGALELGYEGEPDIIRLMSLDLYLYYSDLLSEAFGEVEQEIEEREEASV